jgi:tetratricopeptide (TPR) repeat protein
MTFGPRVMPRATVATLLALLALGAPLHTVAQVAAPRMVDENDDTVDEEPSPRPPPPPTSPPPTSPPPTSPPPAPAPGAAAPSAPAGPSVPPAGPAAPPAAAPRAGSGPSATPAPAAQAPAEPARKIEPVRTSWAALMQAWTDRRRALREMDSVAAQAAQARLLAARAELAIENLPALAAAEAREVSRALDANLPAEALSRAELAVTLAPDWPEAHVARARALLASSTGGPMAALAALRDAAAAAWRDPARTRAAESDALAALLFAAGVGAAVAIVVLALRRLRLILHDVHHLPLLRGAAPAQSAFLALVVLALPAVLGLGPLAVLALWLAAAWLYLTLAERLTASVALLALLALPWAVERAAAQTAWTGTVAEQITRIEHGALSDDEAAAAVSAAQGGGAPAPLLAALGHHLKRRGDLAGALALYRAAAAADPRSPDLLVNIGNVLFIQDDIEGARAAYLAAGDQAGSDVVVRGAAHYDLSKLYLRTSELQRSGTARESAEQEAGPFLARRGSDEDFSANRYLVDVPVPAAKVAALAAGDAAPASLRASLEALLLPPVPPASWGWVAAVLLAAPWALTLAARRIDPSHACHRCGRPACRRCDGAVGPACGQCVNVFDKKGVVDARDRLLKEQQVRRHARLVRAAARALAVVGGGLGHLLTDAPVRGVIFTAGVALIGFTAWTWAGLWPAPYPSGYALPARAVAGVLLGAALWAVGVRDAFRRTRS